MVTLTLLLGLQDSPTQKISWRGGPTFSTVSNTYILGNPTCRQYKTDWKILAWKKFAFILYIRFVFLLSFMISDYKNGYPKGYIYEGVNINNATLGYNQIFDGEKEVGNLQWFVIVFLLC